MIKEGASALAAAVLEEVRVKLSVLSAFLNISHFLMVLLLVLAQIPEQVLLFMQQNKLKPNPPATTTPASS